MIKYIKKNIPALYQFMVMIRRTGIVQVLTTMSSFGRKKNYLKASFSALSKKGKSSAMPILITIEPTNVCDQQCPICETGAGILERPKKNLKLDEFKTIIDKFDNKLEQLFFYFMGEPFLNKFSYEMIRYAADKGIWVETCTNGNFVKPEELVKSGIGKVNFQISGMTHEIHDVYRKGGKLETVLKNIEETVRFRKQYGREKDMEIIVGYILMKHNEHQVEELKEFCEKLDIPYNLIGTTARTAEQAKQYMPTDPFYRIFREDELEKGKLVHKRRPNNYCGYIYSSLNVMANGDVVPCCRDPKGKYVMGNIFEEDVETIWNNEKYQKLRRAVSTNSEKMPLCKLCPGEEIPFLRNSK